ncbi:arsenosugar biosynthesis radical SAM protein ArsS [bacterium]|nr:arsenosugar biosynthesis radical SAM protein ArsS [bacterium]
MTRVSFRETLTTHSLSPRRRTVTTVQVNNGRLCNLACLHCHVEAGPKRTELMDEQTTDRILELLSNSPSVRTVDITGGAPEMNPFFRKMVQGARAQGREVIDRCNLTILFEPGYEDLGEFLAEHSVQIVASLPCYSSENVDKQRGRGTFSESIEALQQLNALGYGKEGSPLKLDLVYNPIGATLPPPQDGLARDYRQRLGDDFGIVFHELYTITNMPIKRFRRQLEQWGELEGYMNLLQENFNPAAVQSVMCRDLISVGYTGELYDCDFNQMLEIPIGGSSELCEIGQSKAHTVWDISSFEELANRDIVFDDHCFGCTAGSGSSCGGALIPNEGMT